jgi:predicted ATPase
MSTLTESLGYEMIRTIQILNFRCYDNLEIQDCARLNVIVGDNGTGKTTLLEAIFLALAASTEVAMRLRQYRGLDGVMAGTVRRIEDAVWGDFFHNYEFNRPVAIKLTGSGPEVRSLQISRSKTEALLPLAGSDFTDTVVSQPVTFTWTDSGGREHSAVPKVSAGALSLPSTDEILPDFFFISSNNNISSVENAARFSELSKSNIKSRFIKAFTGEYPWIKDVGVEVHAGAPALFATLTYTNRKVPITNISTGINRIMGLMLTILERPQGVILIDELENGVYYAHLTSIWKTILALLREGEAQLFVTTHSKECLEALASAAGRNYKDIALWRTERNTNDEFVVRKFSGEDFKAGIEYEEDVR